MLLDAMGPEVMIFAIIIIVAGFLRCVIKR